ncbi:E3 ubiquitin ligase PQT3-like isoform X2 [Telopea speciosissima]|uniref:E3 ubiquitin ligase PQT3-like isoform X2 n=1 Tax=Telopea speciosissima TaxID=54955 RepID=UPI001CC769A7|nr:E3 ubiquitin ligase PQT3-like isoform X2 [Telopea speciosissima]
MAVRFKFRSSVDFDSIDIDGRPSISVRDLRSKILQQKNLKICQNFDLVISDAKTGEEYDDEDFLVPSGSSIVIKRVPAGAGRSVHSALPCINSVENWVAKSTNFIGNAGSSPSMNVDVDNFDDFGIDLYSAPEEALLDSDLDVDKMNCISSEKADNAFQRSSEPSTARCQNIVPGDIIQANPKGVTSFGIEGSQMNLRHKMEEPKKLEEAVKANSPALLNVDLPSELKCSLCNTIFKEAVMIRCCQHSFCEKCIRLVLIEKARCPKCSSTRCGVEDLLPNVSLRHAIDHFLESQMLLSGSDNILPQYAPDGESGIQAKELSCAMSICQREPVMPHSPSGTGKGSNIVMAEYASESVIKSNASAAGTSSRHINLGASKSGKSVPLQNIKQVNGENGAPGCAVNFEYGPEGMKSVTEFQGENQPVKLRQTFREKEAGSTTNMKEKGFWVNTTDGIGSFMATSRHRKGDRTCYMCGSPDHFIRNCPAASSPHPMLQTGDAVFPGGMSTYGPSYWQGSSLSPHIRPFTNIYGNAGLMPFDPAMVPVTPFAMSSYMPSMYSGLAVPYGPMRMVGLVPPVMSGAECALSHSEFMELQDSEQRQKLKQQQRDRSYDGDDHYLYNRPERSLDCKQKIDREYDGNFSVDTVTRRSKQKSAGDKCPDEDVHVLVRRDDLVHSSSGRDHKPHNSDRSSSEMQDSSDSSNWHRKKRHKHNKRSSKQHTERRGECGSNTSHRNHHGSQKEINRQRNVSDAKRCKHKNHSRSELGLEPSSSGDRKRQRRDKECSHSSRHSNRKLKPSEDQLGHDRWEMVEGLDEGYREDGHHHHKRKRIH